MQITGNTLAVDKTVTTDANGAYRISPLPAGTYTLTVSRSGFATQVTQNLEITLNRTVSFNVSLEVGTVQQKVEVTGEIPLLETTSSSSGKTILPQDIGNMPINGRNYLDLLQLVPGVAIYRQADLNSDNATPILGERANNTGFLIDGLPNQNELNGGAAAQFNQDTIAEFQVITTGYKAEFGHSSGGVVNVITKSGGNDTHGLASAYHRNSALDSSDIPGQSNVPYLLRWDYDLAGGGAIIKDRFFWFGSAEGIHENRQLNFATPAGTPQFIVDNEVSYNEPTTDREVRLFTKFDQVLGNHHLTEQMNYTNVHVNSTNPLSASTALPSTRSNLGDRNLFLGFSDTVTFGESGNPFILSLRGQYRDEPTLNSPAHPQAGPDTLFNVFSSYTTNGIFGDVATPEFGSLYTASTLDQKYGTFGVSLAKTFGRHTLKFGWDYERTHVDGMEASAEQNQLFATEADYLQFGPINAGYFLLLTRGGLTPQDAKSSCATIMTGFGFKTTGRSLTVSPSMREFAGTTIPRSRSLPMCLRALGLPGRRIPRPWCEAASDYFYDHFRLGLARDIPGFGGADIRQIQPVSYPRLFYGIPTIAPIVLPPPLCLSSTQTDAQLAGATCPWIGIFVGPGTPYYGVDHLNNIVSAGHAPIPGNSVVNMANIQQLSGLTPDAYLTAADAAIGQPSDFFFWGPFGTLSELPIQAGNFPTTIDPSFATPYSRSYSLGVQRQLASDWVVSLDYYHKDIQNILGVRQTDLAFASRIANNSTAQFVNAFGPWYGGTYDGAILSFEKRLRKRFTLGGSYSYVSENDDALNSNLSTAAVGGGNGYPTDSFRGIVPTVTDPGTATCPSKTNATASFIACNGNYVPQAGKYYNGATLDNGPSDFALRNTFEVHGLLDLPWKIQFSSLLRFQSGFRYTNIAAQPLDQDGNGNYGPRDLKTGRNAFTAPGFYNMDMRISKVWTIRERFKVQGMFEFFNLFNRGNAAAIQNQETQASTLGTVSQRLPGREGQIGLKLEF